MPTLPSRDEIVDFRLSAETNKTRHFVAASFMFLENLSLADRIIIMNYSLTKEQIQQYENLLATVEATNEMVHKAVLEHSFYTKGTLWIFSRPYRFELGSKADGLLSVLYKDKDTMELDRTSYSDFLASNKDSLRDFEITTTQQIKDIKRQIIAKIGEERSDFFIPGYISIQQNYRPDITY